MYYAVPILVHPIDVKLLMDDEQMQVNLKTN